jgi:hypothetical protein
MAAFRRATAYCVLCSAHLLELPSACLLSSGSALLLHTAYINCELHTSVHLLRTAYISTSCYNFRTTTTTYCLLHSSVRLLLQHSSVHLLPRAFISTGTLRLEVPGNREEARNLLRRERNRWQAFGPAHQRLERECQPSGKFAVIAVTPLECRESWVSTAPCVNERAPEGACEFPDNGPGLLHPKPIGGSALALCTRRMRREWQ